MKKEEEGKDKKKGNSSTSLTIFLIFSFAEHL